jgi:hypothetical protein
MRSIARRSISGAVIVLGIPWSPASTAAQQDPGLSGALVAVAQQVRADSFVRYDSSGKHVMPEVWHVVTGDTMTMALARFADIYTISFSPPTPPCTPELSAADTLQVHFQVKVQLKEWNVAGGVIAVERQCSRMRHGRPEPFESVQDYLLAWNGERWLLSLGRRSVT